MLKKGKILATTAGLLFSATAIGGIALTAVSCSSNSDTTAKLPENDAYEMYNSFVRGTHGRWAGNYANFVPKKGQQRSTDIEGKYTFGQFGLTKDNLGLITDKTKNPYVDVNPKDIVYSQTFNATKPLTDSDQAGMGSHYAYEWLYNKLTKDLKLKDLGGTYSVSKGNPKNYPAESKVTLTTADPDLQNYEAKYKLQVPDWKKLTPGTDAALFSTAEGDPNAVAISTKQDTEVNFQKQGLITQGYLWNATDRITGRSVANQYSQNIIVTIKALDEDGTEKYEPIAKGTDPSKVSRNAFWIVAHYDSTGTEGINSKSWGATDNGSGVGAALDLVEYYSNAENAKQLDCDLNIAFVGGEEVGVTGSTALVEQYLNGSDDAINKAQVGGMLNLDTAAGGDIIYIHSPFTKLWEADGKNGKLSVSTETTQSPNAATSTIVRDQLNAVSKMQADAQHDPNAVLQIHPFLTPTPGNEGYLQGQTGDWSDHASFYKLGISNVAYMEATNFQIDGDSGYDGYSQTSNPAAWLYKKKVLNDQGKWVDVVDNQGKLVTKQGTPVQSKYEGEPTIDVWGPGKDDFKPFEEGGKKYKWARYNSGKIWHYDFDTPQFMEEHFKGRMDSQLSNLGATLRTFLKTMNIETFNADLDKPSVSGPGGASDVSKAATTPITPSSVATQNMVTTLKNVQLSPTIYKTSK